MRKQSKILLEDPRAAIDAAKRRVKKARPTTAFDQRLAKQLRNIDELSYRLQRRAKLKDTIALDRPNDIFIPYSTMEYFDPEHFELWVDDSELIIAFEGFGLDPHNSWSWRLALQIFCQAYFAAKGSPATWSPRVASELKAAAEFIRTKMTAESSRVKLLKSTAARKPTKAKVIERLRAEYKKQLGHLSAKRLRELLDDLETGALPFDTLYFAELTQKRLHGIRPRLTAMTKRQRR